MTPNHLAYSRGHAWPKLLLITIGSLMALLLLLTASTAQAQDPEFVPEAPGSISGTVTDDAGTPLAGIDVSVYQGQFGEQVVRILSTDAAGNYRAGVLPPGNYRVGFRDPQRHFALEFNDNAITLASAADIPISGNNVTGINGRLSPGGSISGTVALTGTFPSFFNGTSNVQALYQINGKWEEVARTPVTTPATAYTLTLLPVGNYRVCAEAFYPFFPPVQFYRECYDNIASTIDNAQDVPVVAEQATTNINLVLGDQADLAILGGTVTAPDDTPLANISVSLYRQDFNSTHYGVTDRNGNYQFGGLPPGEYYVGFYDPTGPYLLQYYKNAHVLETAAPIALQPREKKLDVNIRLEKGAQITGTVLLISQTVAANAFVQVFKTGDPVFGGRGASVDPRTGSYTVGGLFPGAYKVLATVYAGGTSFLSGYYGGRDYTEAKEIVISPNETKPDINITVGAGAFEGTISGVVTADGAPRAGIRVTLLSPEFYNPAGSNGLVSRLTDTNGHYRFEGLFDGAYGLLLSDPAGTYATTYHHGQGVIVEPERIMVVGGQAVSGVDVTLAHGGTISGRLYQRNGAGVADALVTLVPAEIARGLPLQAQSSGNGVYKITGVPPGRYRLCAAHNTLGGRCYGASSVDVAPSIAVVADGETKNIDILLGPESRKLYYFPLIGR